MDQLKVLTIESGLGPDLVLGVPVMHSGSALFFWPQAAENGGLLEGPGDRPKHGPRGGFIVRPLVLVGDGSLCFGVPGACGCVPRKSSQSILGWGGADLCYRLCQGQDMAPELILAALGGKRWASPQGFVLAPWPWPDSATVLILGGVVIDAVSTQPAALWGRFRGFLSVEALFQ